MHAIERATKSCETQSTATGRGRRSNVLELSHSAVWTADNNHQITLNLFSEPPSRLQPRLPPQEDITPATTRNWHNIGDRTEGSKWPKQGRLVPAAVALPELRQQQQIYILSPTATAVTTIAASNHHNHGTVFQPF